MYELKLEVHRDDGDGTEWVTLQFKPAPELPNGILRKNRDNPNEQMWAMLEWGLGDQIELFDRSMQKDLREIVQAWQENDGQGVTVGESSASPKSSTATARRSKQTSSD